MIHLSKTLLTSAAVLLAGTAGAFADDAPVVVVPPQNTSVECDGTDSYNSALNDWLNAGGNAIAVDDLGAVTWRNDFTSSALARLSASGQQMAQDQANALNSQFATTGTITQSSAVAAADYLATSTGCVSFTVNFWAVDSAGQETYAGVATFAVVDTTAPTMSWTYKGTAVNDGGMYTTPSSSLPVTVGVSAADVCGGTYLDTRWTWGGATTAPTVSYANGTWTITAGAVGTELILYAKATDECGNVTSEEFVIVQITEPVKGRGKLKGNEGLGNGVDPNTPGHAHNGGNDDPAFSPGNPGARYKNRY